MELAGGGSLVGLSMGSAKLDIRGQETLWARDEDGLQHRMGNLAMKVRR